MADNVAITAGSGTTIAADDVGGGVLQQRVKITHGADGTGNDVNTTTPLPTQPQGNVAHDAVDSGAPTKIGARAVTAAIAAVASGDRVDAIADLYGSLHVIQTNPTGTPIDMTSGTAGVPAGGVVSVQGVASMTALKVDGSAVTQPVSGTVTANVSSVGFDVQTSTTRPANTTAYTAGDVVGGAIDLGVLGPSAGAVMITSVQLELDIAAVPSGMTTFTLYLYSVTPPSAIADNAAFDLPSGDRASYLGSISLGTPADLGSTLYVETNAINKQVKLAGTHLFAYLVTTAGYTPAANSEVYRNTVHTLAL